MGLLTGERGGRPPACQNGSLPDHVMCQEASLIPWEVGNHCPLFPNERFCGFSQGCPSEGWGDPGKEQGDFAGEGTIVKAELQGQQGRIDSPSDLVRGSGVEYRAPGAVPHHLGDPLQIKLCSRRWPRASLLLEHQS